MKNAGRVCLCARAMQSGESVIRCWMPFQDFHRCVVGLSGRSSHADRPVAVR